MIEHVPWWAPAPAYALGYLFGYAHAFLRPRRVRRITNSRVPVRDWRRSFNHENTNGPSGPPPLKFQLSRRLPAPRWENKVPPPCTEEKIRNLTERVQRLEEVALNGGARD